MAYPISIIHGIDLVNTTLASDISSGARVVPHAIGTEVFASDGKIYVFAKAGGSITASTAVCTVNAGTFSATSSGGSYTSPATAMSTGDYGWFSKASV
jgi:hypothetical protein